MKWTPSPNLIAQLAHVGWGGFVPALFRLHHHMLFGAVGMLAFAVVKEFVFDIAVEKATVKDSTVDFFFYCVGIAAGTFA